MSRSRSKGRSRSQEEDTSIASLRRALKTTHLDVEHPNRLAEDHLKQQHPQNVCLTREQQETEWRRLVDTWDKQPPLDRFTDDERLKLLPLIHFWLDAALTMEINRLHHQRQACPANMPFVLEDTWKKVYKAGENLPLSDAEVFHRWCVQVRTTILTPLVEAANKRALSSRPQ